MNSHHRCCAAHDCRYDNLQSRNGCSTKFLSYDFAGPDGQIVGGEEESYTSPSPLFLLLSVRPAGHCAGPQRQRHKGTASLPQGAHR